MTEPRAVGRFSADRQKLLRLLLAEKGVKAPAREGIPRRPAGAPPAPLSFAQQRLWVLDRLAPGSPLYNIPAGVRLTGRLDGQALFAAAVEVVRRHEALRTTFLETSEGPVQVVSPEPRVERAVADLSGLPAGRREEEMWKAMQAEGDRPFDLQTGPLVRALLVRLGAEDHALLLSLHHAVSDGWSSGVFVREMAELYRAFVEGTPARLAELPIQYPDYAAWQRDWLTGKVLEEQLRFWRERLAGAPDELTLPFDRPRPAVPSYRGDWCAADLGRDLADALRELCRREDATLFMALLAASATVLGRLAGQEDVVLGSPIANRHRPEVEGLIGFFANTLALRVDLAGDPPFRELLARVRSATHGAYEHQDLPFERIVEELDPERRAGRNPLFQVTCALQNTPAKDPETPGLALRTLDVATRTAKFDLSLFFNEPKGGLGSAVEYATDLFDTPTAGRLLEHLRTLLTAAAADPDRRLSDLPLLGEAERHQIALEWNDRESCYETGQCVHELFAAQAARTPEAEALVFGDERLTYAELEARANELASQLAALGVGPETRVAVRLERSVELVVSLLAILKAGGAYVPIDPSYPEARADLLMEEAGVAVVVGPHPRPLSRERERGEKPATLPEERSSLCSPLPLAGEGPGVRALAYVLYTSGSTGTPKGVAVPHRAIVRLVRGSDYVSLTPEDRVAQASNASFDAATFEIWGALLNGGCVVGVPREVALEPRLLVDLLRRERVSTLFITTALFHQIAREQPEAFRGLRHVLFGGEAIDPRRPREVLVAGGPERLLHVYGPTESTTFATWERVREVPEGARTVPIGRPIANTRLLMLDRGLRPVPPGVPGELCLGGDGLARGYLGRPALTAEWFVPDPLGEAGERLYRTGDLARLLPDGRVELFGRVDDQVKVRGFRIEPGEIEAALTAHPEVAEAVVLPREEEGSRRLVAYVVPESLDPAGLRAFLRERLPEFMVPSAFVPLAALPLNPNGKVDRRALSRIALAPESGAGEGGRPPRGALEEAIAAVWGEVLGVERVGARDEFFDLGGHSLLALRVLARMRDALGLDVPLRVLFEEPTVEALAAWIEAERGRGALAAAPPIEPVPHDRPLPLSFAQERLWLVDRLYPGTPLYNVPAAIRLRGPLEIPVLAAALAAMIQRHETLRTRYAVTEEGEPVQTVDPEQEIPLPVIDLSTVPTEAERLAWEESIRPFDLQRGPVLRALLLRLGTEDHVAVLTRHHIVSDGWSQDLFAREIGLFYEAFAAGRPSPLPPLPVQYADFAVWQRRHLSDAAVAGQLAWWRERLAGAPPVLELPADRPRPPVQSFEGEIRAVTWAPPFVEALHALARREGGTLFLVLLAAFDALVTRLTGREDVIVGSPVANRPRPELEGLIGFFANTIVLRTDVSGDPPFGELVARSRETSLGAWEHQDLPFERLVEELRPRRDPSHAPLFQVMFVHQAAAVAQPSTAEIPRLQAEPFGGTRAVSRYDLEVYALEAAEGLTLALEYSTTLFDAPRMIRLLGQMETVLRGALATPGLRLSELPLLSEAERQQLLVEWMDGPAVAVEEMLLHELFEAQAARTPEAVALIVGDERWTYRELDARAEEIAAELRSQIGPEDRVAVSMPRTADMVATLLGILKAGGVYVPVDPAYPEARRERILVDAGPRRTLTPGPSPTSGRGVWDTSSNLRPSPARGRGAGGEGSGRLAYLIYTSGSTGEPKGVAIPHASAVALVRWAGTVFSREDLSGVLAGTSINFDLSVFEIFVPLAHGGTVLLADNALELPRLPAAGAATLVNTVPSVMAELVRMGGVPAGVRVINLAGEALTRELADRVQALPQRVRLFNLYGPSEDTTYSTFSAVPRGVSGPPSIGRAIAGTRAVVVDRWLRAASVGVPGELCLAGAGLARGYLGRPGATAEKWVPDPFSGMAGARMYRTGDLVRWRADGELEFLGRIDHQVKVRGFRIEPGEIEAALRAFPGVEEAVVAAREDRLVAWVAGPDPSALAPVALRKFLRERLPEALVPSFFVPLADFPRTSTGKVDRSALPAPGAALPAPVAAAGPLEDLLAGVWAEVLGVETVGLREDFFDLGGHSLLATRLVARVQALLGVELPVRAVFEAPTVASFARAVLAAERGAAPPLVRRPRGGDLPPSFAQERMWFLERLGTTYHIPLAVRLTGSLDAGALEGALREIGRRHEALRTSFPSVDEQPVQRISAEPALSLPRIDLTGLPPAPRAAELERLGAELAWLPFDLQRGPLLRVVLAATGPAEHVLLGTLHHIIADGWSLGVLLHELATLYRALQEGTPAALPELPVQYADWAVWQREWLESGALDAGLAWWRQHLGSDPVVLELPGDRPRPAVPTSRGAEHRQVLPADLVAPLRSLARRNGASLFMALLAAWQVFLARHTGQDDFVVGTPIAGRDRAEIEGLLGLFVNTLALRARVPVEESFTALLAHVREATLGAFAHAHIPFERIVEAVQPRRSLAHTPLFQTMLVLQSAPLPAFDLPGLALAPVEVEIRTAPFDLTLSVSEMADDGLVASWIWARDLFDEPTVARFAERFQALLSAMVNAPDRAIAELPFFAEKPLARDPHPPSPSPTRAHSRPGEGAPPPGALSGSQTLLARIWSDLLRVERPGPDDSFFDLGGHSLLAARMLGRVRETFGVDLPLRSIFETPTLAGLAGRIESLAHAPSPEAPWTPLVRLTEGKAGETPLFCIHGAGGNVAVFADLALLLQEERPVYALEARGLAPGQAPLGRIEEMADLYLDAVREVRPHGPYRLLGYSMGGKVAFEMVRRLEAEGETVDLLALLDIPAVVEDSAQPFEPEIPDLPGIDPESVHRHLAVWRANQEASRQWVPATYSGRVLLILAEEGAGGLASADPTLGWGEVVAGGVEVVRVPGDHFSVLARPYVNAVAEALARARS